MVEESEVAEGTAEPDRLVRIARASRLREGTEGVATFLRVVLRHGPLTLRETARRAKLPVPVATALRRELEKDGLLARGHHLALSDAGRHYLESELGIRSRLDPTCPHCGGAGILLGPELDEVLARFRAHVAQNPVVDVTLDQAPCTPETAFARALYMYRAGSLEGRAVLFLGDDDQVSVAAALLGKALGPRSGFEAGAAFSRRLSVVEIDQRRIDRILDIAARESLAIDCLRLDLRDPLPPPLQGRFQAFATDPPYSLDGASLFLARGIEALEATPGLGAFLSFAELPSDEMLRLQRRIGELGLAIVDILPGFNRYEGASILGSTGQMLQLRSTAASASPYGGARFDGPIYTGELNATVRRYRCTECGLVIEIGSAREIATIEALKARGCPRCRNDRFRRLGRVEEKDG